MFSAASTVFRINDIHYVKTGISVRISFDRQAQNFERAQQWLGEQILTDCLPEMPLRTGSQRQRSYVDEAGSQVIFPGPYAGFLFGGKVMIDPVTGSPWARPGAKKVLTDKDLIYAQGGADWFGVAKEKHLQEWTDGVQRIMEGANGETGSL